MQEILLLTIDLSERNNPCKLSQIRGLRLKKEKKISIPLLKQNNKNTWIKVGIQYYWTIQVHVPWGSQEFGRINRAN